MAEQRAVTVIVPTHQRRAALQRLLLALAEQSADPADFEAVVSIDASTDGTAAMVDALEVPYALRRVAPDARGRAAACNAAAATALGEVLIVLDDDMKPTRELVECHRRHHAPGSRRCVLGAVPVELDKDSTHAARYVEAKFGRHLRRLSDPAHLALPRSFYSGNTSLRAEVLAEVGGFDESFGAYGNEDVELALRLRAAGVELAYDPEALAWQEYGKDIGGLQRDTFEKGRTTVLLARRHPEVFADLRLAEPRDSKRPWLTARSLLLALTRRVPCARTGVFAVVSGLERAGLWRQMLFYRAALDYAFWAGVAAELGEREDEGELRALAEELRRGPIDLFLHG